MAYEPNWVALRLERELHEGVGQHQDKVVGNRSSDIGDSGPKDSTYPRNEPTGVLAAETM